MRLQSGFQKKSIRAIIAGICQKRLYASILDIIPLNCAPETLRRLPKVLRRLLWLPAIKKCAPETSTVLRRLFPYWNLPLWKPAHNLHGEEQGAPPSWRSCLTGGEASLRSTPADLAISFPTGPQCSSNGCWCITTISGWAGGVGWRMGTSLLYMRHPANSMSTRQTVMKEPKKYQPGVIEFSYPSSKNGGMTF